MHSALRRRWPLPPAGGSPLGLMSSVTLSFLCTRLFSPVPPPPTARSVSGHICGMFVNGDSASGHSVGRGRGVFLCSTGGRTPLTRSRGLVAFGCLVSRLGRLAVEWGLRLEPGDTSVEASRGACLCVHFSVDTKIFGAVSTRRRRDSSYFLKVFFFFSLTALLSRNHISLPPPPRAAGQTGMRITQPPSTQGLLRPELHQAPFRPSERQS